MPPDSPDPLTLASSPLSARPFLRRDSRAPSTKPRTTLSPRKHSPAKSFLIDPALATHDQSPYRIRVTVSAEPNMSASPKKTRTMRVPLRGGMSSSPRKDATELEGDGTGVEADGGARRVKRKRKGTPVAPRRRARKESPAKIAEVEDEEEDAPAPMLQEFPTPQFQHQARSSVMLPSSELRRRRMPPMRTQRYARLSAARDELDLALQDAVGATVVPAFEGMGGHLSSDAVGLSSPTGGDLGGDGEMTVANEDFTMISGAEMASIMAGTSMLHNSVHATNEIAASLRATGEQAEKQEISTFPSSPPSEKETGSVRYPDLTGISGTKDNEREASYDVMSWQPTRPATASRSQLLSQELERSRPRSPQVISDDSDSSSEDNQDAQVGAANPADDVVHENTEPAMDDIDDDIWAEEASRSLENDAAAESVDFVPPIFSDQPEKPRRSKIPNTWRRVSGNDFLYSDSPARATDQVEREEEGEVEQDGDMKGMETDAESRRSSGVLTPPSTDNDEGGKKWREVENPSNIEANAGETHDSPLEDDDPEDEEISGLTEPNAADTQLEAQHRLHSSPAEAQPEESEDEPTGYYWRQHKQAAQQLPLSRPRPFLREESKTKYDLSAILRMDDTEVADPGTIDTASKSETRAATAQSQPAPAPKPQYRSARAEQRRLLRAQRQNLQDSLESSQSVSLEDSQASKTYEVPLWQSQSIVDDSLASKASDQRQMLGELKSTTPLVKRRPAGERLQVLRQEEVAVEVSQQSYEEILNVESPQKIRVKFGDSSLLEPGQPLGAKDANAWLGRVGVAEGKESGKSGLVRTKPKTRLFDTVTPATRATKPEQRDENENNGTTGLLTRLTSSLWSNINLNLIRPQGPTYTYAPPTTSQPVTTATTPLPRSLQTLPVSLRAQLRSRYGVLASSHPWTMAHMRTLHRLLNSLATGRRDSIVPTHIPLPPQIRGLVGREQCTSTGGAYMFGFEHGCVIMAFMQLLVSPSLIQSMDSGEVEALGDLQSQRLRGFMGGRHGAEVCFRTVRGGEGGIEVGWVVGALGCCARANEEGLVVGEEVVEEDGFERAEVGSVMGDGRGDERVRRWIGGRV